MRRKGVYGRIFAIILAATMALGTAPEAALMVQAEGIESEQINEEGTDDQGDEGNTDTDPSEGEGVGDENRSENEGGSEDENQPGNEEGSEDENQPGDEEGSDDENQPGDGEDSEEGSGDEDADGEEAENGEEESEAAPWEDTSELTDEELEFYNNYTLTDEDKAAIENGEMTLKELIQKRMSEAEEAEEEIEDDSINVEKETNDTSAAYETPDYYGLNVENGVITGFKTGEDKEEVNIYIDTWNVSKIADGAFQNNTTLKKLYIYIDRLGGDVPPFEIGDNAFKGCTNLEYLSTVSINKIGAHAFDGTKLGKSGTLNIQAKKIGAYAFANITGAGSNFEVSFSPSVNEIGNGAFDGTKLAKVTFTGNVATIGRYSSVSGNGPFAGSIDLTTAVFADGISYIPNNIFKGSSITTVTIPSSVTRIEEYAFANCSNLASVSLPSNLTYIGREAFAGSGLTGTVTIPDNVTEIGYEAFYNIATLTGVQLSANLQKIDSGAFAKTGLTSITIPKYVNSVGKYNNESGDGPFWGARNLTTAAFESGMTAIPANIFKGSSVTTVTIPSSVTRIEKYAFTNCSNLASVSLPSNLTYIGKKAFCESRLTGTVTIPDNVTEIGDEAFYNIATLTGVQLSARLRTIGSGAFAKTGLTSVTIPKDVKTVGRYSAQDGNGPFWGASSLTTAVFADGITSIPNNIFKGSSVTTVTIPSSVQRIEEYAFTACNNLTTVTLPSGLTYIGRKAFYGSGLTGTVKIPFAVTEIVDYAFGNCTYLEFAEFGTKVTKLGSGIWDGCSSIKLKVIKGTTTEKTLRSKGYGSLIQYYNGPEFTINYDLDGGSNNVANPGSYYWSSTLTLKNPTKPGYTFKGWYTSNTYKTKVTSIAKGSTGDKTFYAKWTANKYTVKFNANGGKGTTKSMSCNYDGTYNLRANKCSRKGYRFAGWARSKNGDVVYTDCASIKNLTTKSKGTVTLYAKWEKINYTINYNNLEGATNGSNPASYTVTNTFKLKNAYKEGYTFNGWYKDAKLKNKVTKITKGTTGNKTFYAKFTGNKYYVIFNIKGNIVPLSGTYHDGVYLLYVDDSFDPGDGTTFAGWNTKEDGTGTHYDASDSMAVFAKPGKKATKITLYAEWE